MTKPQKTELTTAELAQQLGITVKSTLGLINRGHFPNAHKISEGKTMPYLIPLTDIEAYLSMREARKQKRRQPKRLRRNALLGPRGPTATDQILADEIVDGQHIKNRIARL